MKVTVIPIVICALGKVKKGFVKGLEDLEIRGRVISQNSEKLSRSKIIKSIRQDMTAWAM